MRTGTGIFLCILIAILLAVLVLWCADVLAHRNDCVKSHFVPCTNADPNWGEDWHNCGDGGTGKSYVGGHGHNLANGGRSYMTKGGYRIAKKLYANEDDCEVKDDLPHTHLLSGCEPHGHDDHHDKSEHDSNGGHCFGTDGKTSRHSHPCGVEGHTNERVHSTGEHTNNSTSGKHTSLTCAVKTGRHKHGCSLAGHTVYDDHDVKLHDHGNQHDDYDCRASDPPPPPPPPPPPQPEPEPPPSPRRHTTPQRTPQETSTTLTTQEASTTSTTQEASTISVIVQALDNAIDTLPIEEDIEVEEVEDVEAPEVEDVEVPEPESCDEEQVQRWFYKEYTLYTPTVVPEGVETMADLWEEYWWTGANGGAFYVLVDFLWFVYSGSGDVGNLPLNTISGILVYQAAYSTFAGLTGCPVATPPQIQLQAGLNLIGFPTVPPSIQRPSDLLSAAVIAVLVTQKGQFKVVSRADDPGDEPLHDGQGLLVLASEASTISLSVAQAPRADRTLTTTWGKVKVY